MHRTRIGNMVKIGKWQARRLYLAGKTVTWAADKMRIEASIKINKEVCNNRDFELVYNEFMYYNCSAEAGRRVSFYADIEDVFGKEAIQ